MVSRFLFTLCVALLSWQAVAKPPAEANPRSAPSSVPAEANPRSAPSSVPAWHKVTDAVWSLFGVQITVPPADTAVAQNRHLPLLGVRSPEDRFHAAFLVTDRSGAEEAVAKAHSHGAEESKPVALKWKPADATLKFVGERYDLKVAGQKAPRQKGYGYLSDGKKYLVFFFEVKEVAANLSGDALLPVLLDSVKFGRPL